MGGHDDCDPNPVKRTDGGLIERPSGRGARQAARTLEQPALERHELPGMIQVGDYHEYCHDGRWTATDTPLGGDPARLTEDEWLTYDVDIREPGPYDLALRVATAEGTEATIGVVVDDEPLQRLTVRSDGRDSWTGTKTWVELPAGLHTIRVVVFEGDVKLDRIEFR